MADPDVEASFVTITMSTDTADGARTDITLSATAEHYLLTGATCCSELKTAGSVRIGDKLWARGADAAVPATVTALSTKRDVGKHSPVLTHGTYPIVDGVVTSFDHAAGVQIMASLAPWMEPALAAVCGSPCLSLARRLFFQPSVRYIDGYKSPPA